MRGQPLFETVNPRYTVAGHSGRSCLTSYFQEEVIPPAQRGPSYKVIFLSSEEQAKPAMSGSEENTYENYVTWAAQYLQRENRKQFQSSVRLLGVRAILKAVERLDVREQLQLLKDLPARLKISPDDAAWIKLSESAFEFWDNPEDAIYDNS